MRLLFLPLLVFVLASTSFAQYDVSIMHSDHFHLQASQYVPSKLGDDYKKVTVILPGGNTFYRNTSDLSLPDLNDLYFSNDYDYDDLLSKVDEQNEVNFGSSFNVIGVSYKHVHPDGAINDYDDELFTVSAGKNDRFLFSNTFDKNIFRLLHFNKDQGNAFTGFTQAPTFAAKATLTWFSEYYAGFAMPLPIQLGDKLKIKAGARIKYLFGEMYMESVAITNPSGTNEALYTLSSSGVPYGQVSSPFDITNGGNSVGFDFGGTVTFDEKFKGSLSVIDIGSVTYKKALDGLNYVVGDQYKGVPVKDILTGAIDRDSLEAANAALTSSNLSKETKVKLPTRLVLQGEYVIAKENPNGRPYNQSHIYFTYIQGVKDGAVMGITDPFVSVGYGHNVSTVFNPQVNLTYSSYTDFMVGYFMSFRAGFFRMGFGSNNILGLSSMFGNGGSGYADFSAYWSLNI